MNTVLSFLSSTLQGVFTVAGFVGCCFAVYRAIVIIEKTFDYVGETFDYIQRKYIQRKWNAICKSVENAICKYNEEILVAEICIIAIFFFWFIGSGCWRDVKF